MSEDGSQEHSDQKQDRNTGEHLQAFGPPDDANLGNPGKKPDPPNCVEKWTFIVLVATFGAALLAGIEAWRLADLTQTAIRDARTSAADTHADTIRAENLTADALGQAQSIANVSHSDNANGMSLAKNANIASQKLTRESNGINKQAFTATQRAFVLVTGFRKMAVTDAAGKITSLEITPIIKNTGNTPATNASFVTVGPVSERMFPSRVARDVKTRIVLSDVRAPADPDDILTQHPDGSESLIVSNIYIGPGTEIPVDAFFGGVRMNMQSFNDIASGRTGSFLYGSIHYSDIFGKSHISKYCFFLNSIELQGGGVDFNPPLCRHWNCLDEDCAKDKAAYFADVDVAKRKESEGDERVDALRKRFLPPAPPTK